MLHRSTFGGCCSGIEPCVGWPQEPLAQINLYQTWLHGLAGFPVKEPAGAEVGYAEACGAAKLCQVTLQALTTNLAYRIQLCQTGASSQGARQVPLQLDLAPAQS